MTEPRTEAGLAAAQLLGVPFSPRAWRNAILAIEDQAAQTYADHPFKQGGYLSEPTPEDECVWRVDGHSPYCGIERRDHDATLAERRAGTWQWTSPADDDAILAAVGEAAQAARAEIAEKVRGLPPLYNTGQWAPRDKGVYLFRDAVLRLIEGGPDDR